MLWGKATQNDITTSDLPWWHSEKEAAWEWNVRPSIKKQTIEYFMFEGNCVFCHLYLGKGKQQKMQLYPVLKSQTWRGENFYALWFRTTCHISLSALMLAIFWKLSQSLKILLHGFLFLQILAFLCMACCAPAFYSTQHWFLLVVTLCFLGTTFLCFYHLFLDTYLKGANVNWTKLVSVSTMSSEVNPEVQMTMLWFFEFNMIFLAAS